VFLVFGGLSGFGDEENAARPALEPVAGRTEPKLSFPGAEEEVVLVAGDAKLSREWRA